MDIGRSLRRSPYVCISLYASVKYSQNNKEILFNFKKVLTNQTKCAIIICREAQRPELTN